MYYATFHPDKTLNLRLIKGTHVIPEEAVEVDASLWPRLVSETDGIWVLDSQGAITKQSFPPVVRTREVVEHLRHLAYADPVLGSDRYFAEASRMQMMGEPGWEVLKERGIARFNEIQALYPWPEEEK